MTSYSDINFPFYLVTEQVVICVSIIIIMKDVYKVPDVRIGADGSARTRLTCL